MTSPSHHEQRPFDGDLERYLDGLMEAGEARRFEAMIADNPTLQAEVELHGRVEASLQRLFVPPIQGSQNGTTSEPVPAIAEPAPAEIAGRIAPHRTGRRILGGVAAGFAAGIGIWLVWSTLRPQPAGYDPGPWRDLASSYALVVDEGFEPDWICKDDAEFQSAFRSRFDQPLSLDGLPEDVQAVGLAYRNTVSARTILVLGEAGGERVVLYVDRVEADHGQPAPPAESGLKLFRARVGQLAVYELTPLDHPVLLEFLRSGDQRSDIVEPVEGG